MEIIQVDGGMSIARNVGSVNSIGVLYPAERVDFILFWDVSAMGSSTEVIIGLDDEYVPVDEIALSLTRLGTSFDPTLRLHRLSPS